MKFSNYYQVPNNLHQFLMPNEFVVCCLLLRMATRQTSRTVFFAEKSVLLKQNELTTSIRALSSQTSIKPNNVIDAINRLAELSFITILDTEDETCLLIEIDKPYIFIFCQS